MQTYVLFTESVTPEQCFKDLWVVKDGVGRGYKGKHNNY